MLSLLRRHTIQVLLAAGHIHVEVARFVGVTEQRAFLPGSLLHTFHPLALAEQRLPDIFHCAAGCAGREVALTAAARIW